VSVIYDFHERLKFGKKGEAIIARHLTETYGGRTEESTEEEDRAGIDFWWYINGRRIAIQSKYEDYLFDKANEEFYKQFYSGNVALEIWSVDKVERGCHWKGDSQYVAHLMADGYILFFRTQKLQTYLQLHWDYYRQKEIQNKTYKSTVVLVPFADLRKYNLLHRIEKISL
jgi:hypothetical protein